MEEIDDAGDADGDLLLFCVFGEVVCEPFTVKLLSNILLSASTRSGPAPSERLKGVSGRR